MTRPVLWIALVFGLTACQNQDPPVVVSAETTAAGQEFVLVALADNPDISVQIAWPTDWPLREDVNPAVPYVGADLILAGGAEGYSPGEVVERFADMDAEGNLQVMIDHVIGRLTFPAEETDNTIPIAAAHLVAPALAPDWFSRIRDGLEQNIAEAEAQPSYQVFAVARQAIFGEHPVRAAMSLDVAGIYEEMTIDDVVAWHRATITNAPTAIVIAGELDAAAAGTIIDDLLADLPAPVAANATPIRPDFSPRRILLHVPDAATSTLAFMGPMPPTGDAHEFDDLILTQLLGQGDQSVLFEAIRTELRASYGFSAWLDLFNRQTRIFAMMGEVETAKLAEAETAVREAYANFLEELPSTDLAAVKEPLSRNLEDVHEYVFDIANTALENALDGREPQRVTDLAAELDAVTIETLRNRAATAFPAEDHLLMIAVSPDADALPGACVITEMAAARDCAP